MPRRVPFLLLRRRIGARRIDIQNEPEERVAGAQAPSPDDLTGGLSLDTVRASVETIGQVERRARLQAPELVVDVVEGRNRGGELARGPALVPQLKGLQHF